MNKYDEEYFSEIVKRSINISDVVRNLNLSTGKGNRDTTKKYIEKYNLNTDHFILRGGNVNNFNKKLTEEILVKNSTYYSTTHLKNRLYKEGLKKRECELCEQKELWKGKQMSLILDHKNGINNDNRIENLQIVCPNCNATLETNCSKNKSRFTHYEHMKNYCECGKIISKQSKRCQICDEINQRKIERPPYDQLLEEVEELGYCGTGRKYNVSDNSIRKWKKYYEKLK